MEWSLSAALRLKHIYISHSLNSFGQWTSSQSQCLLASDLWTDKGINSWTKLLAVNSSPNNTVQSLRDSLKGLVFHSSLALQFVQHFVPTVQWRKPLWKSSKIQPRGFYISYSKTLRWDSNPDSRPFMLHIQALKAPIPAKEDSPSAATMDSNPKADPQEPLYAKPRHRRHPRGRAGVYFLSESTTCSTAKIPGSTVVLRAAHKGALS